MKNLKGTRLWAARRHDMILLMSILFVLTWTAIAPGQLGMGDSKGIAQQRLKPRLIRISGRLQEIKTHPCENTTGKAELGTHLILKDKHGQELNIHLGPTSELSETIKWLTVGMKIDLFGFRTEKMSPNHYVAKTLILANHVIQLRDSDLRPYWSNNRLSEKNTSSFMATTGKRITSETTGSLCYYPKFWQRCCFRDGQRACWRRRCRGRNCGR
jgi:hypothetical protein